MYLVLRTWTSPNKALEMGQFFNKVAKEFNWDKYGKLGEQVLPTILIPTKDGINSIEVLKIDKGKLEDAIKLRTENLVKGMAIETYRWQIDVAYDGDDVASILGSNLPF